MREECSTCRFYVGQVCRRHAPIVPLLIDPNKFSSPVWPYTQFNDWCGDYEQKRDEQPKR